MQATHVENTPAEVQTPEQQKAYEALMAPVNFYHEERLPDELDLVATIRQLMIEAGLKDRVEVAFDPHPHVQDASNRHAHVQQYHLNLYLSLQFMSCPQDVSLILYTLIYEIRPDQWLEIFKKNILPAMITLDLPRVI